MSPAVDPVGLMEQLEATSPVEFRRADEQLGATVRRRLILAFRCEIHVESDRLRLIHRVSANASDRRLTEQWVEAAIAEHDVVTAEVEALSAGRDETPAVPLKGPDRAPSLAESSEPEPVYLDCNGSTPVDERVIARVALSLRHPGNPGADHAHGRQARERVHAARADVAMVVGRTADDVIWTSNATEANNLALLSLIDASPPGPRGHVLAMGGQHPSVERPLEQLALHGFDVEQIPLDSGGLVTADAIVDRLRDDTRLVSVLHANNVTGVVQPLDEIAAVMGRHPAILHVDGSQSFGRELYGDLHPAVDLLTVSSHKTYGPAGVAALIVGPAFDRSALRPRSWGGGQEDGLRPGTESVALIDGFGEAARLARAERDQRVRSNTAFRQRALKALAPLEPVIVGHQVRCQPHVLCIAFPGLEASEVALAVAPWATIGTGAACSSGSSPVLEAMGLDDTTRLGAVRLSWCHETPEPDWVAIVNAIAALPRSRPVTELCRG